ncbi:hypothetical protein [Patiriisocius marinus]|uniref:Uncharacterized protein n=1 Tax=Patiriisocius marinus TaxID=1397112 RepID=A0A5J4IXY9_9FLAO|nr:hypothetical protein [Patiriisocius marinus]GER58478.1 hypothetical protein ULMA_05860 [Patiriisocius marinus]
MKTLKTILITAILGIISQSNPVNAQDYLQLLDPIFISMESESSIISKSYMKFNDEIIATENFRFNNAIRQAEDEDDELFNSTDEASLNIKKADYLRILRKAANRNETVDGFVNTLSQELPELSTELQDTGDTNALFTFTRSNTINGKLEAVGSNLSWL